jgi:hypothetical protein
VPAYLPAEESCDRLHRQRREKIAPAKRGKPRPPEVAEAVRQACLGTPLSEETRRKIGEAHRRRGTVPLLAATSCHARGRRG